VDLTQVGLCFVTENPDAGTLGRSVFLGSLFLCGYYLPSHPIGFVNGSQNALALALKENDGDVTSPERRFIGNSVVNDFHKARTGFYVAAAISNDPSSSMVNINGKRAPSAGK
jgi:hypothetical protein